MIELRAETRFAIQAVTDALATARRRTGDVHFKVGRDVVTDTDIAVEDAVREALWRELGHRLVGEERGGEIPLDAPYWLLDPICGTRNFASGIPLRREPRVRRTQRDLDCRRR